MGLDLTLIPKDTYLLSLLNETSLDDEIKTEMENAIREAAAINKNISPNILEFLMALGQLSCRTEEDAYFINLFYHLYRPDNQLPDITPLLAKYRFITDNETLASESRVGSYSTIHYLRSFCDKTFECLERNIPTNTVDTVRRILEECARSGWSYGYERCPALCHHSDCDGYYLPTLEPFDFEHGSSYKLFLELDRLYSSGAVNILYKLKNEANVESILWAFEILMYYILESLMYNEILGFC